MTQAAAAAAAAGAIELCSWHPHGKTQPVCNKPATHKVRWPWGEEGFICPDCIPLVHQTEANIKQKATLQSLDTSTQQPVTLHERTALIAAKLSAEAELTEVTKRGEQLYRNNVDLTQQVQTHVMQKRELEAQLTGVRAELGELGERLQQREHQLAESNAELQRLQVLVPFVGKETTPEDRGLPSSSVVD